MKRISVAVLFLLAVGLSNGCNKLKDEVLPNSEKKVETHSTAAQPVVPVVEKQPTMFEWHGVHNGMTLADFQAKYPGMFCGNPALDKYGPKCATHNWPAGQADGDVDIIASFFQGQVYHFTVDCHFGSACEPLFASLKAHFGEPIYDKHDNGEGLGWRVIRWESSLEFGEYEPPYDVSSQSKDAGELYVCSFALSPTGECSPDGGN